jgi:NAD(P)-dependent dehydrogenase (short-subunit alcohol dehydrogenase family)
MKTGHDIADKVVFVTGANRGIGRAVVDCFIRNGARKVYAAARNPRAAKHQLGAHSGKLELLELDLTLPATVAAAAQHAADTDIVVNSAGVLSTTTALGQHALESLKHEIEINAFGLVRLAQAFGPVLARNGDGVFVQLNSVASIKYFGHLTTYCASKAASYAITQSLRDLWKARGIRVVSVHPGPMATDMGTTAGFAEIAEPPSVVADAILSALGTNDFHVFPGSMAAVIGSAYASYAREIVDVDLAAEPLPAAREPELSTAIA